MLNVFKKSSEILKPRAHVVLSGSLNEDMNFLEGHPDAIFILNTKGEILTCNSKLLVLLGYKREKLKSFLEEVVPPTYREEVKKSFQSTLKGKTVHYSIVIRQQNGQLLTTEITNIPYYQEGVISGVYGIVRDVTEEQTFKKNYADLVKRNEEEVWRLATHDHVTGLPNRFYLMNTAEQWLNEEKSMTVLAVSFNQINEINRTLGYAYGDLWLHATAQLLKNNTPKEAFIGQLIGDDYVILLPELIGFNKEEWIETLLSFNNHKISLESYEWYAKVSLGVSNSSPGEGEKAETLIRHANIALDRSKKSTTKVHIYDAYLDIEAFKRYKIYSDLRYAVLREELFLEYQPKVNAWTGKVEGAEALIRWDHPKWGRIPPNDFIPLAEESSIHLKIADWVVEETCRQLSEWKKQNLLLVPISINVSPKRLLHGDFAEVVFKNLRKHKLPSSLFEIEISETDILYENVKISETLRQLHDKGISISLDDFGKGYSSISYLQDYPIDTIKIDRKFIKDIDSEIRARSIVRSAIFIGQEFRLNIVAEGVETAAQLQVLRGLDCPTIQGYLFSQPLLEQDFAEVLSRQLLLPKEEITNKEIATLSLQAKLTIDRIDEVPVKIGSSVIMICRTNLKNLTFYSNIRFPVKEEVEYRLTVELTDRFQDVSIRLHAMKELSNGLLEYEGYYTSIHQSHIVITAFQNLR
ncbi:sensor domain-containing protein [Exiguobacterium antarcticum]|uniref:sensor domain-containing protein n=1 Tax=Exiguobacterium antarcticum TaxID=132920 RepID=UPI000478E61B|nr:EAL domain-containing protein [Exiguobacterium antarcticum]